MDNNILATKLYEVLGTPVSVKILEKLNPSELRNLDYRHHEYQHYNKLNTAKASEGMFQEEENEQVSIIKSILDNGKARLRPRTYQSKTEFYLQSKKLI